MVNQIDRKYIDDDVVYKTLFQQPKYDTISRQAAINEAEDWIDAVYFGENYKRERKAIKCVIRSIKNMPSAQPESSWIPCEDCERRCDKWERSKT